ncbi:nucleotide-binding domain-containing protein [Coniochaeta sp. PMI_546]|nr:nucleotide-binding domain-containing protein [Coniochaeta sp. PMI_546]
MAAPDQLNIFAIVGAGVFGLSTGSHLRRAHPDAQVLLIDRERGDRGAASSDLNKIIRARLPRPSEIGMGRASFNNYKTLAVDSKSGFMSPDEAHARFPIFDDANWEDVQETTNTTPESEWGEAEEAIASIFQAACDEGVIFIEATAEKLILGTDASCLGVAIVRNGEKENLLADRTVLCVGAHTAKTLADTAPDRDALQVDGRLVAAAAVQCTAKYPPDQEEKLNKAPVHFIGMWHTHGESIPPFKGRLKFNCEGYIHPSSGCKSEHLQDVPEGLKEEVANVVKNTYGRHVPGIEIESYRMCWDAVNPNQDFIIDYHPKCENLVIATAGSFHSWKLLPTIGKYVVQKIFGTLEEDLARKWAWDRVNSGSACEMYEPTRDMKTIGPFLGWPQTANTSNGTAI